MTATSGTGCEAASGFSKNAAGVPRGRGRPSSQPPGIPLRELRVGRGVTLTELAERSGVATATLSQIERGRLLPEPRHVAALSTALDVPYEKWRIRFVLEVEESA